VILRRVQYIVACLLALVLPGAAALLLGQDPMVWALTGEALACAAMAWWKPGWFWQNDEIEAWRSLTGDRAFVGLWYSVAALFALLAVAFAR
jgi:hypothetical protein